LSALFGFALGVTGPTFFWVLCGALLARVGRLSDHWVRELSLLVFRVGLPLVLFFGAVRVDYRRMMTATYLLAGIVATFAIVALALVYARSRRMAVEDRALFVQAAYRANLGVIGIALCAQAYGEEGLALAALPVAVMTILFNLIAVILLNHAYGREQSPLGFIRGVLSNPLILGIGAGVVVSLLGIELPALVQRFGAAAAALVLPLALLAIGASLNLRALRSSGLLTLEACIWKLLLAPAVGVVIAVVMGVHGAELAVLFLLLASPAAAASYIMVMAAGGNGALAANIVVVSTLMSAFTLTLGLAILQWWGFV